MTAVEGSKLCVSPRNFPDHSVS